VEGRIRVAETGDGYPVERVHKLTSRPNPLVVRLRRGTKAIAAKSVTPDAKKNFGHEVD